MEANSSLLLIQSRGSEHVRLLLLLPGDRRSKSEHQLNDQLFTGSLGVTQLFFFYFFFLTLRNAAHVISTWQESRKFMKLQSLYSIEEDWKFMVLIHDDVRPRFQQHLAETQLIVIQPARAFRLWSSSMSCTNAPKQKNSINIRAEGKPVGSTVNWVMESGGQGEWSKKKKKGVRLQVFKK